MEEIPTKTPEALKRAVSLGLLPALIVAAVLAVSLLILPAGAKGTVASIACSYGGGGAPTTTGINPISGTTAGGTVVVITGCGFTGATGVKFGLTAGTSVIVNSDSQVTATSPAHVAGFVDITVTTAKGTSATSAADQFEFIAPNSHCTSATLSPSSGSFQVGTTINFTAVSHGCLGPRYAFWVLDPGGTWTFAQNFGGPTFNWMTTGLVPGTYTIHVWVNVTGNDHDAIGSATIILTGCATASLAPPTTTQPVGTTINFTASSTGCASPRYAFWVLDPSGNWAFDRGFGGPTWGWMTTGLAPGTYTVHVWVNTQGNSYDAFGSSTVTLTGCATASLAPPTVTQAHGTTINFTASSTGCASPHYAFWAQYPGGVWHFIRNFDGPVFAWSTAGLAAGTYTVHVWVNTQGNSFDAFGSSTVTLT